MLNQNLENFSRNLILGKHHSISSTGIYKRAMLTGYLSVLVVIISVFYIFFDLYLGLLDAFLFYLMLINFAIIAFFLNRTGRYEYSKILLLLSTLFIVFLFTTSDPENSGIYFVFFPITVAAFALFDYKAIHKGVIFALITIGIFLIVHVYKIPLLPVRYTPAESASSIFLIHYLISLWSTVLIIIFLIKLNKTIEINLIRKDENLSNTTEELMASKQRFELAISGSNSGIYDWDIQNDVVFHSPMWKKLLGYQVHELDGLAKDTFYEFMHPEDVERAKLILESHLLYDSRYAVEMRLRIKSGEYQWFSDSGQAVWDESGTPVRMVGSIIKIHDRKVAEERIKKQNSMLEKANLELDNFVYSASHDIRSPLTSVLGLINIASKTNDAVEVNKCLNLMKSRVHRLDEFIEDILDFSRNVHVDIKLREINLNIFIDEILKEHDFANYFKNLEVRLSLSSDFEVISDPFRLKIILKKLLTNSCQFSNLRSGGSWLSISALRADGNFQLIIEDNGEGIRDEFQDKVFDMFYRASEKSEGSGLGLYIVKEMIEKLNGTIKLNSIYGQGSRFIIELPDYNYAHQKGSSAGQQIKSF